MESLAAKLAAGPPAKPVGLVKQVDHTATDAGVAAEASSAEKALGGVLTGSLAGQSTVDVADKEAATEGCVWWVHALDGIVCEDVPCVGGDMWVAAVRVRPCASATYHTGGPRSAAFLLPLSLVCLLVRSPMDTIRFVGSLPPHSKPREALFADLAAKLAAGPPAHPVGLVKQQEGPWEPATGEASAAEKKLGSLLQESLAPKGDGQ